MTNSKRHGARSADFGSAAPALIGLLLNLITDIQSLLERVAVAYSATVGLPEKSRSFSPMDKLSFQDMPGALRLSDVRFCKRL